VTPRKVDDNQAEIVKVLREIGATVWSTAAIGNGFPDLAVGFAGVNTLLEVKDGDKPPSRQRLTPAEFRFHTTWKGQIAIVTSPGEAVDVVRQRALGLGGNLIA